MARRSTPSLGTTGPRFWFWWGIWSLSGVSAWVTISRHSTQLALDAILDDRVSKLLTTGALFRTAYKDVTLEGASDTDCYIAVGDIRGFDRALFETPQVCLQMQIFPDAPRTVEDPEVAPVELGLPQAVILGMHGSQATVAGLNYFGQYSQVTFDNPGPINLPYENYPVALATDPFGGVFLGLHDTAGILPPAATNEDDELQQLYDYHQGLTRPELTTHVTSPDIIKLDVLTGETDWTLPLETTGGRSVVGNILYLTGKDTLVVAGSSNGSGRFVGSESPRNDWDGFVTLIDSVSGTAPNGTLLAAEHSLSISSQPGLDDYVTGICYLDGILYVLGSTSGRMSTSSEARNGGGFLMSVDIDTLEVLWRHQWNGDGVEPLECYAEQDFIYVVGHVPANVWLEEDETRTEASPDQDLLVALLSTADGSLRWTRQIDSRRPDHLAGAAISALGDIIITANGMQFEEGTSDIYTMTVSQGSGFHDWQDLPRSADPIGSRAVNAGEENLSGGETFEEIVDDEDNQAIVIAVAVVVPVVLLLLVLVCARQRRAGSNNQMEPSKVERNATTLPEEIVV